MGRIVVTEFVSLDGVVEDPGGAEDFKYGGWSFEFSRGDEGDKFKLDETLRVRGAAARPRDLRGLRRGLAVQRDGEFADKFNSMPKYVVSSTLDDPEWNNSTVLDGRPRRGGREAQAASTTATSSSTAAPSSCRR